MKKIISPFVPGLYSVCCVKAQNTITSAGVYSVPEGRYECKEIQEVEKLNNDKC